MERADRSLWLLLLPGFAATAGVVAAGVLLGTAAPSNQRPAPAQPISPPVDWFGGASAANMEALGYLFASENESGSLLLWTLQALSANNWAGLLARKHPQVRSIADMLRAGYEKSAKRWHFGLDWGPQYDKVRKITRWAATTKGLSKSSLNWRFFEFASRLLKNELNLAELTGKRGERMIPWEQWGDPVSFLQYEGFGETVQRQVGADVDTDVEHVLRRWDQPRLITSVEGVRFYGR